MHTITVFEDFSSAHFLPNVPIGHKCKRVHGHNYHVEISISGPIDPALGWVVDYADVKERLAETCKAIDHRVLNETPGLENPTTEILCQWFWDRLKGQVPGLVKIRIAENPYSFCEYEGVK